MRRKKKNKKKLNFYFNYKNSINKKISNKYKIINANKIYQETTLIK